VQLPKRKIVAQAPPGQPHGDRKLAHDGRILGTVHEWNGQWGWIVPLQKVSHPQFRGKLYAHRKDVKTSLGALAAGNTVDFILYADSRGLGAGDIREAEPGMAGAVEPGEVGINVAEERLPDGWEKIWSEEHSEYYYWNKSMKESSWVPPELPESVAQENRDNEALPDGWSKNFDPEHNEYYYWHAPTKTTSWERPKKPSDEQPPAEKEDTAQQAEPEVRPAVDGPALGQQRVKGRVEKWQGFFGWIVPTQELSAELKPLLESRQDKIYCNWRDVQEGITIKAGSLVDFLLYADDNGLGASDVRLQKDSEDEVKPAPVARGRGPKRSAPKDAMAELEQQWAEQDAQLAEGADMAAEENAPVEPAGDVDDAKLDDAPLLPGWEQVWSEEHASFYYWHKTAKQACWERPCVPVSSAKRREDKVWEGEGVEEGAARLATPITPVGRAQAGKEITPLTPATVADKEAAKLATKQASAGFRAAQAAGTFRGRGWQGSAAEGGKPAEDHALTHGKAAIAKRPGTPTPAKAKAAGTKTAPFSAWPQNTTKRQRT